VEGGGGGGGGFSPCNPPASYAYICPWLKSFSQCFSQLFCLTLLASIACLSFSSKCTLSDFTFDSLILFASPVWLYFFPPIPHVPSAHTASLFISDSHSLFQVFCTCLCTSPSLPSTPGHRHIFPSVTSLTSTYGHPSISVFFSLLQNVRPNHSVFKHISAIVLLRSWNEMLLWFSLLPFILAYFKISASVTKFQ